MRFWRRLDNAAKIFPSAANGHDTNVFRIYCELNECVDKVFLQNALDKVIAEFPVFRSVMKKGLFWYYLEESDILPMVKEESESPCSKIYDKDVKKLLFRVTYFEKRINLDVYHVLADGTGAEEFLKVLVSNYLCLKYKINVEYLNLDFDSSVFQKADDSYMKFYEKDKSKNVGLKRAYKIKGLKTYNKNLKVIEGRMSSRAVLDKAHEYNATVTSFITGVLLKAIYDNMSIMERDRPVVVSIPVNLRKFFDSASVRNFFGVVFLSYDFRKESIELGNIIKFADNFLKKELSGEKIKLRMNALIGVERNVVIRMIPLLLKNFVLGNVFKMSEKKETTNISNIGKIDMPDELKKYIHSFGLLVATNKLQLGICTFDDVLTISFSSCFFNTDIERCFFRLLTEMGINIEVVANYIEGQV